VALFSHKLVVAVKQQGLGLKKIRAIFQFDA
jgi:hypothetical protein